MKRNKRGIYQASNVTFNPSTLEAFSYSWWKFVGVVDGKLIFNNYRYSNTTNKHQWKVRRLMNQLGIKPDLEMPLPAGIIGDSLEALIVAAEEQLCNEFLSQLLKRQEAYDRRKRKKLTAKLQDYLENTLHFRDYDIKLKSQFGHVNKIAVHQQVDADSLEHDVENAIHNFQRDGFGSIVFYV